MCLKYGLKSKSRGKGETRYMNIINKTKILLSIKITSYLKSSLSYKYTYHNCTEKNIINNELLHL